MERNRRIWNALREDIREMILEKMWYELSKVPNKYKDDFWIRANTEWIDAISRDVIRPYRVDVENEMRIFYKDDKKKLHKIEKKFPSFGIMCQLN